MTFFIKTLLTNVLNIFQKKFKVTNSNSEKMHPNLHMYFLEPKLQIRKYIINNSRKVLHLKLVMSSVPVLIGISQIIYLKYQDQTFSYFFKKNLPGISSEQAKISWQTFEQVFSDQLKLDNLLAISHLSDENQILKNRTFNQHDKFIHEPILQTGLPSSYGVPSSELQSKPLKNSFTILNDLYIKRVDFYSDSILIKTSSNWNTKKNQFFIGTFPNTKYLTNSSTDTFAFNGALQNNKSKEFGSNEGTLQVPSLPKETSLENTSCLDLQTANQFVNQVEKFQNKIQFGNNWYLIPAKDIFTCSTNTKNTYLQSNLKNMVTHPLLCKAKGVTSLQKKLHFLKSNQSYFYQFFLHLDELPVKLEESSTDKMHQSENLIATNKKIFQIKQNLESKLNLNQKACFQKEKEISFNTLRCFSFSRLAKMRLASKMNGRAYFSQLPFNFVSHKIKKIPKNSLCLPNKNSIPFFKGVKNFNLNNVSLLEEVFSLCNEGTLQATSLPNDVTKQEPKETNKFTNFYTELSREQEISFLQDEIKKSFYEKNLKPILNLSSLGSEILDELEEKEILSLGSEILDELEEKEILSWVSDTTDSTKLLELISELETSTFQESGEGIKPEHFMFLKTDVVSPRLMSGYRFPDMNNKSNLSALIQFFYKKKNNLFSMIFSNFYEKNYNPILKIDLSKNFSYSFEFLNSKLNAPKSPFSFKKQITYSKFQHPETIVYQGPVVFQDEITNELSITSSEKIIKQKNLDETHTPSCFQLTQWVKQFLDADNPLSDRRDTFFGKNVFDELSNLQENSIDPLLCNANSSVEPHPTSGEVPFGNEVSLQGTSLLPNPGTPSVQVPKLESSLSTFNVGNEFANSEPETDFLIKVPLIKKSTSPQKTFQAPLVLNELVIAGLPDQEIPDKHLLKDEILDYSPIIPSHNESYVVYLQESEWHTFYKKIATKEPPLPLIEVYSPKQGFIEWPLNQLDYQGVEHFNYTKKFDRISPEARTFFNEAEGTVFNEVEGTVFNETEGTMFSETEKTVFSETEGVTDSILNEKSFDKKQFFNTFQPNFSFLLPQNPPCSGLQTAKQFVNFGLQNNGSNGPLNKTNVVIQNYHFLPYSQTLTKQILPKKYFFGKISKKRLSIYKNTEKTKGGETPKFSQLFLEVFEPINSDSWLFVTQFSIAFFLFQILQTILQKYETELKYVFSALSENETETGTGKSAGLELGFNEQDEKGDLNKQDDKFRFIKNGKKRFHDIAGIDTILPELGEIVWFLRNSGRSFKVGNTIPKGILLTGPPGTGKTLLVQAIAGEAEVPVLIESGSSLKHPSTSETGAERLKSIFQKAREMSPCILFIDEIDTLGETRDEILENPITTNEIINSIYPSLKNTKENLVNSDNLFLVPQSRIFRKNETIESSQAEFLSDAETDNSKDLSGQLSNRLNKKHQNQNLSKQQKSNLLLQFLIELDGIANQKKIVVIGATNRPQILDAALTRPGRFDKVLELKLPGKEKRIEILKLYSKNLGVDRTIYWDYLANLTMGFSAADLASVMNQSSMKAIENETIHTLQTIEYGINSISGYTVSSPAASSRFTKQKTAQNVSEKISTKNQFISDTTVVFATRLAYYQAGKAIIHTLLEHHPPVIVLHLWPQLKTPRYHLVNAIIEKEFSQIHTRIELESRVIGFYAGKAAELLGLFYAHPDLSFNNGVNKKYKQGNTAHIFLSFWQSDLGIEDISFASWVIQLMINKWYFYSKKISTQKLNQLYDNSNLEQISEFGVFEFFKHLSFEMETRVNYGLQSNQSPVAHETSFGFENSQNWITTPWLQTQITKKLGFIHLKNNYWYKIYVGDHEENENTRCVSPDEYYHNNVSLNNLVQNKLELPEKKRATTWNNLVNSNRDYIYHGVTLNCFNKAISILDENRELLDYFASYLVQKEVIREHEILEIINKFSFQTPKKDSKEPIKITKQQKFSITNFSKTSNGNQTKKIIEKSWGKYSRKKLCRFITFETMENE